MLAVGFPKTSLLMSISVAFSRAYPQNRAKQFQYLLFPPFVEIDAWGQLLSREINLTRQTKVGKQEAH